MGLAFLLLFFFAPGLVSQTQLDAWTVLWQGRLQLSNWDVQTIVVRIGDLKDGTLGNIWWNSENHIATIRVLDPRDYEIPAKDIPHDIQYTVLHELVHLRLSTLPRTVETKREEELVVNAISDSLMSLSSKLESH